MGQAKKQAEKRADDYEWARGVLCEVKAIKECERHEGVFYDGPADVEDAYRLVNARVTSKEIILEQDQTRRDLTDLIQEVYQDNSGVSRCPICEKNLGPD